MNLDASKMVDAVHAYIAALNAGDIDAIVALYADDATVRDPVDSPPRVGRVAIREFYNASRAMKLDVVLEGEIRIVDCICVFPFHVDITAKDESSTIRVIDMFEFGATGHIQSMKAYFGPTNIHH